MNLPLRRIASAPTRPLTAANAPSLRWTWMIGLGPMPAHAELKVWVTDEFGACLMPAAYFAALSRSCAAWMTSRGVSPASRLRT